MCKVLQPFRDLGEQREFSGMRCSVPNRHLKTSTSGGLCPGTPASSVLGVQTRAGQTVASRLRHPM